jgi:hypothetical protein
MREELSMTAAALTPRVRVLMACDSIKPSQIEDDVFHLRGVRYCVTADSSPFQPKQLWVYLLLSSPREGKYPGYVMVLDDQADKMIFYSNIDPVPVFQEGFEFLPVPVPLKCQFPHAGRYLIQIWFFRGEQADVIKAEQPFDVVQEA